ncbi:MAG: class I SAM-dependent methyltransferase [Rubrobacter sp.]|nr:class I SAM-dependent methyltransferase [Rubrobacter sp.]
MFRRELLAIVQPDPSAEPGLVFFDGTEEDGRIRRGRARSRAGETYHIENGYLDLLDHGLGADNIANLTNYLPGASRLYEPLWRVRSLNLLTGERFPNDREIDLVSALVGLDRGGRFLDLGCSAGLYTRTMARRLGGRGDVVGVDISPSMLKEAARRARRLGSSPSFARADIKRLPFMDGSFSGAVCGGTLNELGDPGLALRETHRVLAPGSRLVIMGILQARTRRGRLLQRALSTGGVSFFAPDEVQRLLEDSGFRPDPLETRGAAFFAAASRV